MARILPEIVLLPGLDGTGELFERLVRQLAGRALTTVVRYPPNPRMNYAQYAAFAVDKIGNRRVVVLGESFSGPVAVKLAAGHPEKVRGLILSATFLESPFPGWLTRLGSGLDPYLTPSLIRRRVLMGRFGDKALANQVRNIVTSMPPGVRQSRLREVSRVNVTDAFLKLACPVLVLHGDADWLVSRAPIERVSSSRSNATTAILPAAHLLLQTRAAEAADHIISFVNGLPE